MNKFAWLFCGCILALSACSERQLGPDPGTTDGPEIRFGVSEQGSGTKALIEANGLAVAGTQLHVFDILTGFNGTVNTPGPNNTVVTQTSDGTAPITYIDKTIGYVGSAWPFVTADGTVDTPAYYRWTKTGTHTFFGYLTKDPAGNTFTGATMNGKVLSISERALTPATTPQFDFLYSDIVKRNAATGPYTAIPLSMQHLFTALSVNVKSTYTSALTNLSVTFTAMHPSQSAAVDYEQLTNNLPKVTYTPGASTPLLLGTLPTVPAATESGETVTPSETSLFSGPDGTFRLFWPETIRNNEVRVSYTLPSGRTITRTAPLINVFENNKLEAGKKYILELTLLGDMLILDVRVVEWEDVSISINYTDIPTWDDGFGWDANSYADIETSEDDTIIYVKTDGTPATFNFNIRTPEGWNWVAELVTLQGQEGFFTFDGTNTVTSGRVGTPATISVQIPAAAPSETQRARLKFYVRTILGDQSKEVEIGNYILSRGI